MPGKFLAEFELYLLLAIARLEDDAYGAEIRRLIEDRTGRPVSIGAMYLTLSRLNAKRLVTHKVSEPTPEQGGRARKYYRLTRAGRDATSHSVTMLNRMTMGLKFAPEKGRGR